MLNYIRSINQHLLLVHIYSHDIALHEFVSLALLYCIGQGEDFTYGGDFISLVGAELLQGGDFFDVKKSAPRRLYFRGGRTFEGADLFYDTGSNVMLCWCAERKYWAITDYVLAELLLVTSTGEVSFITGLPKT